MTFDWKPTGDDIDGDDIDDDAFCDMPDGAMLRLESLVGDRWWFSVTLAPIVRGPDYSSASEGCPSPRTAAQARWLAEAAYIRLKFEGQYEAELERLRADNATMANIFADLVIDSDALALAYRNGVTRGRADTAATPTTP